MSVKSVDAFGYIKIGTNDGQCGNCVMAIGKLLQAKRTKLFWMPCVAHYLDLMLEDIGKIAKVKKLVGCFYNHSLALNTMRKFTNKFELVRHRVTRFATTFLTLQRLHK
ncbi:hypothetical protein CR513_59673, partial [Mucuna pruriens]